MTIHACIPCSNNESNGGDCDGRHLNYNGCDKRKPPALPRDYTTCYHHFKEGNCGYWEKKQTCKNCEHYKLAELPIVEQGRMKKIPERPFFKPSKRQNATIYIIFFLLGVALSGLLIKGLVLTKEGYERTWMTEESLFLK